MERAQLEFFSAELQLSHRFKVSLWTSTTDHKSHLRFLRAFPQLPFEKQNKAKLCKPPIFQIAGWFWGERGVRGGNGRTTKLLVLT